MEKRKNVYIAPTVSSEDFCLEQGIAASSDQMEQLDRPRNEWGWEE